MKCEHTSMLPNFLKPILIINSQNTEEYIDNFFLFFSSTKDSAMYVGPYVYILFTLAMEIYNQSH